MSEARRWSAEEVAVMMRDSTPNSRNPWTSPLADEVVDEEQVHVDDGCHVRRVRLKNGQLFHVTTEEVVEDPDWWREE